MTLCQRLFPRRWEVGENTIGLQGKRKIRFTQLVDWTMRSRKWRRGDGQWINCSSDWRVATRPRLKPEAHFLVIVFFALSSWECWIVDLCVDYCLHHKCTNPLAFRNGMSGGFSLPLWDVHFIHYFAHALQPLLLPIIIRAAYIVLSTPVS